MRVKTSKVDVIVQEAYCDCEHEGKLVFTGTVITDVAPPIYEYKCESCGELRNLRQLFPKVTYEPQSEG